MCSLAFGIDASTELDMHELLNDPINDSESEWLGHLMIDGEVWLEDDAPALQDHAASMVEDLMIMSNDTEHIKLDMKCIHHVLHDVEGGAGELKILGLNEDACELSSVRENEQIKTAHKRNVNHHKANVDTNPNRITDETNTLHYFAHCHATDVIFWFSMISVFFI